MKIWLLNSKHGKKLYGNKRILEEGKNKGVNIKFINIEDIELVIHSQWIEKLFYKNKPVSLPDVVFARNNTSYQMKSIAEFLEHKGVMMINDNSARFLAKDKFLSLQKLAIHKLPVPKTILLKWVPNIDFIEQQLEYPIIIKKIEWAQGKWIIKVNNKGDLEDFMEMFEESISGLNKNLILQEFIGEKAGEDLRIFVVWWKVVWSMLRKWKQWDFKSNYSGWWEVFHHCLTPQEEKIALEAASIIGLDIAGIDVLFDKDNGYKICEVNASPGFEGLEKATGANIAKEIIDYIIIKYQEKQK